MSSELFVKVNSDLQSALKAKDELRLAVLRMVKSKILYVNARGDLPEEEITKIIKKYSKDLKQSIEEFKKVSKNEEVATHEKELAIVAEYLPPELTPEEIKKIVQQAIADTGAASMKDMGKVMKEVTGKNQGIDGKIASQMVRELLNK
ncbi:MAG: GatB/YqeY domain-containing protein [Candidatus Margulisiibacteriota bacterium]|nr:GatB/YqeY domain-containing protein [Candidatus Margulisiibacteriota bacterium]